MFHTRDQFKRLFSRDAADTLNAHSAFLNNLCGGDAIAIDRPDTPGPDNPPRVSVRVEELRRMINATDAENASATDKTIQSFFNGYGSDSPIPNPSASSNNMKTDSWTRGDEDATDHKPCGVVVPVVTRVVDGGTTVYFIFRKMTFDTDGKLVSVSKEYRSFNLSI